MFSFGESFPSHSNRFEGKEISFSFLFFIFWFFGVVNSSQFVKIYKKKLSQERMKHNKCLIVHNDEWISFPFFSFFAHFLHLFSWKMLETHKNTNNNNKWLFVSKKKEENSLFPFIKEMRRIRKKFFFSSFKWLTGCCLIEFSVNYATGISWIDC